MENLERLVRELVKLSDETPWLEFKHNNYDPEMIGKDISALANSATLHEKSCAYMIWGVNDKTHEIIGTDHDLQSIKYNECVNDDVKLYKTCFGVMWVQNMIIRGGIQWNC